MCHFANPIPGSLTKAYDKIPGHVYISLELGPNLIYDKVAQYSEQDSTLLPTVLVSFYPFANRFQS